MLADYGTKNRGMLTYLGENGTAVKAQSLQRWTQRMSVAINRSTMEELWFRVVEIRRTGRRCSDGCGHPLRWSVRGWLRADRAGEEKRIGVKSRGKTVIHITVLCSHVRSNSGGRRHARCASSWWWVACLWCLPWRRLRSQTRKKLEFNRT